MVTKNESTPFLVDQLEPPSTSTKQMNLSMKHRRRYLKWIFIILFSVSLVVILHHIHRPKLSVISTTKRNNIVPIEEAKRHTIPVDDGIFLWFRTWGNTEGVPGK
jgi:hypothetical protein